MVRADMQVTILMGVKDGAAFLPAQLASIAAQSHPDWHLICADDGSTDDSSDILSAFARDNPGKVTIRAGPRRGFSANYMALIAALPAQTGHVCFADQDDIWMPDKISHALNELGQNTRQPSLYCGRHWLWYTGRKPDRLSRRMRHPCTLLNALTENVVAGNTLMLNPQAARLARRAARLTGAVYAHDWWLYLLITACGGTVLFDNGPPKLLYRQHQGNAIGAGRSLSAQLRRKIGVLRGEFHAKVSANLRALHNVRPMLTDEARDTIDSFAAARRKTGVGCLIALRRLGAYRQSRLGTLGFLGAVSLGRV